MIEREFTFYSDEIIDKKEELQGEFIITVGIENSDGDDPQGEIVSIFCAHDNKNYTISDFPKDERIKIENQVRALISEFAEEAYQDYWEQAADKYEEE